MYKNVRAPRMQLGRFFLESAQPRGIGLGTLHGHHQSLRGSLADSRLKPRLLALVALLHVFERVEQFFIPKCASRLLENIEPQHSSVSRFTCRARRRLRFSRPALFVGFF